MTNQPDWEQDIDDLFDHMVTNLDDDLSEAKDWTFTFQAQELSALEEVAEELDGEFMVMLQENVQHIDMEGNLTLGGPMLSVARRAVLTPDEVKALAQRFQALAEERGLTYGGVTCYEAIDDEELFGWLEPEDAIWRLRHMTSCGLEENAELPWTFLVLTFSMQELESIAGKLSAAGYVDLDVFDEPDEEGNFALCAFVEGRNNELELDEATKVIQKIAETNGGRLHGIQFYTREDMHEVFGTGEDEDE